MTEPTTTHRPPEQTLTMDRIQTLLLARQQAYTTSYRYQALLAAEAARLGIDADWLEQLTKTTLYNDFARRVNTDLGTADGGTA